MKIIIKTPMNTLLFQSFQNQTVGMTAILTSGEGPGENLIPTWMMMMIIRMIVIFTRMMVLNNDHHDHLRGVQGGVRDVCPHS